jgi:hypothetical protein
MEHSMICPDLEGSSSMFSFSYKYRNRLEDLSVGDKITISGFPDKYHLKNFSRIMLRSDHPLDSSDKSYEYLISEKDLTYTVKRKV